MPESFEDGRTWIVAADGGGASIFLELRRGATLEAVRTITPTVEDHVEQRHERATGHGGAGPRHGMAGEETPHAETERRFLERLTDILEAEAAGYDHLVIFAPARALGVLRAGLGPHARSRLRLDAPRDIRRADAAEVRARLLDLRRSAD